MVDWDERETKKQESKANASGSPQKVDSLSGGKVQYDSPSIQITFIYLIFFSRHF